MIPEVADMMIISQSCAKRQEHKSDTTERHGAVAGASDTTERHGAVAGAGRLGARRGKGTPKRFCQKRGGKGRRRGGRGQEGTQVPN